MADLKAMAQQAIDVQDACNGSGVARALVRAIDIIRESPGDTGTTYRNQHPIVYLFTNKLLALAGQDESLNPRYEWAIDQCCKIVSTLDADPAAVVVIEPYQERV